MKKIAFFGISTHLGGAEQSLCHFLKFAKEKDAFDITVVLPKTEGPLVDRLRQEAVKIYFLELPQGFLQISRKNPIVLILTFPWILFLAGRAYFNIRDFLQKENFDVVHTTGLKFHILLSLYGMAHIQKICLHLRDIFTNPFLIFFFRWASRRKNIHLVCNSMATAQSMSPTPSKVIYNGFDDQHFSPLSAATLRSELKIPKTALVIGIVGAIARWKGQREFLQMAAQLNAQNPELYFVIVGSEIYDTSGDKGELAYLKNWVQTHGLNGRVIFVPFLENVSKAYKSFDIFVHASIRPEPFGRVLVEAMMCGLPVVASNQGGPLEIVADKKNGLLYQQGDPKDMAEKVGRLLSHPEERTTYAQQAQKIGEKFASDKTHGDLEAFLQNI